MQYLAGLLDIEIHPSIVLGISVKVREKELKVITVLKVVA